MNRLIITSMTRRSDICRKMADRIFAVKAALGLHALSSAAVFALALLELLVVTLVLALAPAVFSATLGVAIFVLLLLSVLVTAATAAVPVVFLALSFATDCTGLDMLALMFTAVPLADTPADTLVAVAVAAVVLMLVLVFETSAEVPLVTLNT